MNKIKILYDVITKMKEKKITKGEIKALGFIGSNQILDFENKFEKNLETDQVKLKIHSEMDCQGNKVSHESTTEFGVKGFHNQFWKRPDRMNLHHYHQHHHLECCGMKEKLNRLAFFFELLNNLQIEEKEDGHLNLGVIINNIPEDLQKSFREKMTHKMNPQSRGLQKYLLSMVNPELRLHIRINQNREIEKAVITMEGHQEDENGEDNDLNIQVEIDLH